MSTVVKFIAGVFLFAGLPLLGWGLGDIEGFMSHSARLAYLVMVVVLQAGIVLKWPEVGQRGGDGVQIVQRQRLAIILLQLVSLAMVILAPYSDRWNWGTFSDFAWGRYLGLVLFATSFVGMNWAEASLGRQFSVQVTLQSGHQLVTQGLYHYIRHPRYASIIGYNLGLALLYRSWLALLIVGGLTVILLWRIHDEEILLSQAFGQEWESYVKHSKRLIPWLY